MKKNKNATSSNDGIKRVLCIVSGMNRGGAETFLMKIYRTLDKNKYQMDFCVTTEGVYDEEIKSMGGKIFMIPQKSKNPIKSFIAIQKIVRENQYKSVLRTCQHSLAAMDLLAAKLGGAKKLIYRSSNAGITEKGFGKFINNFFSFLPKIIPNVKIAPSTEAAEFVFGKKAVSKNKVVILHNALNYREFEFNEEIRKKIREELKIKNETVYGHVGRFNVQKNHMFLLDIFEEIHRDNSNSILLLIGEGELKKEVLTKIKKLKLEKNVIVLGTRKNINEYMMAMDLFLFPSIFEGMPNVIIEAQATGLRCIVSDSITKEANITGIVKYISLDENAEGWANVALNYGNYQRKDYYDKFLEKGYCIENVCNDVCMYFFE